MKLSRTKPRDAQVERNLVKAAIVSDKCVREMAHIYQDHHLQTKMSRIVGKWAINFFNKYERSPKQDIEDIFRRNEDYLDEDLAENIKKFLSSISEEYEREDVFNDEYWIDQMVQYFAKWDYKKLIKNVETAIEEEDIQQAKAYHESFYSRSVEIDKGDDIFSRDNVNRLRLSLEEGSGGFLFRFPGALHYLVGDIERSTMLGFMGREKVGKSYFFQNLAFFAAMQKCDVVVFDVGDMPKDRFDLRYYSQLTRKPYKETYSGKIVIPSLDCYRNQVEGLCEYGMGGIIDFDTEGKIQGMKSLHEALDHEPCIQCWKDRSTRKKGEFKGSIWWKEIDSPGVWSWREAVSKAEKFQKRYKGSIKRVCWPMGSTTVKDIESYILKYKDEYSKVPDVVIVDYADILLPDRQTEYRHQENEKWKSLRGLSQRYHICVITGTQSDAKSYKKVLLSLDNFSEDKRKFGHVTHFFSFNKTEKEENMGCMRVGTLLLREDEIHLIKEATVLQCYKQGQPYLASFLGRSPVI